MSQTKCFSSCQMKLVSRLLSLLCLVDSKSPRIQGVALTKSIEIGRFIRFNDLLRNLRCGVIRRTKRF